MSYWTAFCVSDRHHIPSKSQWMQILKKKSKKKKPLQMILFPLLILNFTERGMCLYPVAPNPDPHRILYLTAMPIKTHKCTTALSRTNSVQTPHCGQLKWTSSPTSASPPAGTNLQLTSLNLSAPGLKGAKYRPRGTASFHSPNESSRQCAREARIKDPFSFLSRYNSSRDFLFLISFPFYFTYDLIYF